MAESGIEEYKSYLKEKASLLRSIVEKISAGDHDYDIPRTDIDDRFPELYEDFKAAIKVISDKEAELDETKRGTLNLLEDLEQSRAKIEEGRLKEVAMVESIGDGLIATDEFGRIIKINKNAEKILGFSESDLVGQYFMDAIKSLDEKGEPIPRAERHIVKALTGGQREHGKAFYIRKDGTMVPVEMTISPIMVGDYPIGIIEIFRDITKEREIDIAKTEFVSLASHQLRTPLSAINWYSEMLLGGDAGELNSDQKKYMSEVYRGSQRMVELVNALLNVSRIDLGTFAIEPAPTNFTEIADRLLTELQPKIIAKHLKIEKEYEKDLPLVNADPKLIGIIIQNLLSNSTKYTLDGGTVGIKIYKKELDMVIEIYDTGVGIPLNQQDKIFTKLFRADNAREIESDGTGLGLYIIKSVVERSGGEIWFESAQNKGTRFFVTIPLAGMIKQTGVKDLS